MGYTIKEVDITNFKDLKATKVEIGNKSFAIVGKNGAGKSSLIQAMKAPFDTNSLPPEPVTNGEERAHISIVLTDGNIDAEYTIDMSFSQKNKKGTVIIRNKDGEKVANSKAWVEKMFHARSFDISQFLRESKQKQVMMVRDLCDKEILSQVDALTEERQRVFDKRTYDNRFLKEQDAKLKNHGYTDEQIREYKNPLPAEAIESKIEQRQEEIRKYERIEDGVESKGKEIEAIEENVYSNNADIDEIRAEIERLQKKIEQKTDSINEMLEKTKALKEEISKGNAWLLKNEKPTMADLQEELKEIQRHNLEHERITKYREEIRSLAGKRNEIADADKRIQQIDNDRVKLMQKSGIPVEGLSFTTEGVTFNGLPLDPNQIEKSQLMKISAEIGMALNPTLKTIWMEDASLLDKESMDYVRRLCEDRGFQLIMEIVDNNAEIEIKFFEEEMK